MPKIMLVEDDNNLREIYEARLLAEGYEVISAKDGEEALALATKEKPDLIISDVMMPKISGFDMLDILRSTPEVQNTKVVMMTALSQAENKENADKLGADRYLVKSQVTLEDVARVADELINGTTNQEATSIEATNNTQSANQGQENNNESVTQQSDNIAPTPAPQQQNEAPTSSGAPGQPAPVSQQPRPATNTSAQNPPSARAPEKIELPKDGTANAQTSAEEEAAIDKQIDEFVQNQLHSNEPPETAAPEKTLAEEDTDPNNQLNQGEGFQLPSAEPTQAIAVKQDPGANQHEATSAPPQQPSPNQVTQQNPKTPKPSSSTDVQPSTPTKSPESISGGQRVIQPISNPDAQKPNLAKLAATEEEQALSEPLSASSIVAPNAQTATPSLNTQNNQNDPDPTAAGSIIQPSHSQDNQDNGQPQNPQVQSHNLNNPNNIAL